MDVREHIDLQRWLINSNMINDLHKNTIFMYGSLLHKDVKAVEADINVENKVITYKIYLPYNIIRLKQKMLGLSSSQSIIGLWRYKRMLAKNGNLDFQAIASKFIKDYLGPNWNTKVEVLDIENYDASAQISPSPTPGTESL
jgi:hypothetical protein